MDNLKLLEWLRAGDITVCGKDMILFQATTEDHVIIMDSRRHNEILCEVTPDTEITEVFLEGSPQMEIKCPGKFLYLRRMFFEQKLSIITHSHRHGTDAFLVDMDPDLLDDLSQEELTKTFDIDYEEGRGEEIDCRRAEIIKPPETS